MVYPVIHKVLILISLIPTEYHTIDDVNETLNAFSEIREKLTSGVYEEISKEIVVS